MQSARLRTFDRSASIHYGGWDVHVGRNGGRVERRIAYMASSLCPSRNSVDWIRVYRRGKSPGRAHVSTEKTRYTGVASNWTGILSLLCKMIFSRPRFPYVSFGKIIICRLTRNKWREVRNNYCMGTLWYSEAGLCTAILYTFDILQVHKVFVAFGNVQIGTIFFVKRSWPSVWDATIGSPTISRFINIPLQTSHCWLKKT